MDKPVHSYTELFTQLGLPSHEKGIQQFLVEHRPLAAETVLADAPFWTNAQAEFLREQWAEDANWVQAIDQLNVSLRGDAEHA